MSRESSLYIIFISAWAVCDICVVVLAWSILWQLGIAVIMATAISVGLAANKLLKEDQKRATTTAPKL